MADKKRFKVALSCPGEQRGIIEEVATLLSQEYGRANILYDKYHAAEFARPNLDLYLPNLYNNHSELVVYFFNKDYAAKEWCKLEWRVIREMIKKGRDESLMQFRFGDFSKEDAEAAGLLSIDGYIEINTQTAADICRDIIERTRVNETTLLKLNSLDSPTGLETLRNIEKQLAELAKAGHSAATETQVQILTKEKDDLRQLLLQKEDIIVQQEKTRQELESSLAAEQGKEELKRKALIAVEEKNYDEAEKLVKEAAKESIQETAAHFYQLGKIKELKLEFSEAVEYYELAAKIAPGNTTYLHKAGQLCRTFGFLDRALGYLEKALSLDLHLYGEEHENTALDFNELGSIWQDKGNLDKAIEYYTRALNIDLELFGEENYDTAVHYNNLGVVRQDKGELDKAIEYYEKALKIDLELFGEENSNTAIDYNNLGLAWKCKGDLDKAIAYYERALNIDLELFGKVHPNIAIRYNNLGLAWQGKGKLDKAIEYGEKALKIDLELFGKKHPNVAIRYNNLGEAWRNKGELDKGIEYYEKALKIDLELFGKEHPNVAIRYNNLGLAWKGKGDLDKAIEYYQKAIKIDLKLFGEENPNTAIDYNNLGAVWQDKGDMCKAIEFGEKSYAIFLRLYGADNPSTKTAKENLDVYKARGKNE